MKDRPRIAIIGYGSILNPDDITEEFDHLDRRVCPVRVDDFKRIFNQEASWRQTSQDERAVLNVVQSNENWFNGILIGDLSRAEFADLQHRERGYRFVEVESNQIDIYNPEDIEPDGINVNWSAVEEQDLILTTTGKKTDSGALPISDYLEICKEGAQRWGDVFFQDFLETTETNASDSLSDKLN